MKGDCEGFRLPGEGGQRGVGFKTNPKGLIIRQ
jgi:hypothetical protein